MGARVRPTVTVTPPPHTGDMTRQLVLLDTPSGSWHLDDATRAIGLRGLADARSALRAARSRVGDAADTRALTADAA
jgi:hypothetical protein